MQFSNRAVLVRQSFGIRLANKLPSCVDFPTDAPFFRRIFGIAVSTGFHPGPDNTPSRLGFPLEKRPFFQAACSSLFSSMGFRVSFYPPHLLFRERRLDGPFSSQLHTSRKSSLLGDPIVPRFIGRNPQHPFPTRMRPLSLQSPHLHPSPVPGSYRPPLIYSPPNRRLFESSLSSSPFFPLAGNRLRPSAH